MKVQDRPSLQQIREYVQQILPLESLDDLRDKPDLVEKVAPATESMARSKKEASEAREVLRKVARNEQFSDRERIALEAIILPQSRPVLDIVDGTYADQQGQWESLNGVSVRGRIERAIPSVGRLELPGNERMPYAGTGFVVAPDLVMTNRHVAEVFSSGLGIRGLNFLPGRTAGIDFLEEYGKGNSLFLEVRHVEMIHPFWDMALLRVANLPAEQTPLRLSLTAAVDLSNREVAVIGYPAFDPRNDEEVQRRVFRGIYDVKRLQPGRIAGRSWVTSFNNVVHATIHDASTLGGNSGSCVLDLTTGEVVALHFGGRYLKANYAVPSSELARDSFVVDTGVKFAGDVAPGPVPWLARWHDADPDETAIAVGSSAPPDDPVTPAVAMASAGGTLDVTIPIRVRLSIGQPQPTAVSTSPSASVTPAVEAPRTEPDPNYGNRAGYDEDFLSGHRVRVPWLTGEQYALTARNGTATSRRHLLPYEHFSVVMNRERRLAFFTAVNIDGVTYTDIDRDDFRDNWVFDPRIDESLQLGNDYYKDRGGVSNPLDRGHLVRRLDPCWGSSRAEILRAHHDTFHYTNSAPQHAKFNRRTSVWLGVEDYILRNTDIEDFRVSVFSGPVLRSDDPPYRTPTDLQLQVPLEYWKVVAWVDGQGTLRASGYLLSQDGLVDDLLETFVFGDFRDYHVPIADIEAASQLTFRDLDGADVFDADVESTVGGRRRRLRSVTEALMGV